MSITQIIAATTGGASGESTEFTTTSRGFWLHGDGFKGRGGPPSLPRERATVQRIGPSGVYVNATNLDGDIYVSANPNTVFVDLPAGTYRISKTETALAASVGYQEDV